MSGITVGSIAELLAAIGAVVGLFLIAFQIRSEREQSARQADVESLLKLSDEFKALWNERWTEHVQVFRTASRPMLKRDITEVRYMLNWVNWIGTMNRVGVIPDHSAMLDPAAIGPAMSEILRLGRPMIQEDVWRYGPSYWSDLLPIARSIHAGAAGSPSMDCEWLLRMLQPGSDLNTRVGRERIAPASSEGTASGEEYPKSVIDELRPRFDHAETQLHAGGWRSTDWILRTLEIGPGDTVLDLCCGEGASLAWIAQVTGARCVGLDKNRGAIARASRDAQRLGVGALCRFEECDVLEEPFDLEDGSVTHIIGQDPDALANARSDHTFAELFRVLRPGGVFFFHHWVPQRGVPEEVQARFDEANVESGYPSHVGVNAERYIGQLERAGFTAINEYDLSDLYTETHRATVDKLKREVLGRSVWTETWLELGRMHPLGVGIACRAPA